MKKIALFIFMVAIMSSIVSCSLPNNSGTSNPLSNNSSNTLSDSTTKISSEIGVSNVTSAPDESTSETSSEDMATQINQYLDIMLTDVDHTLSETDYVKKFPNEFASIVAFGEEAFSILDEIINKHKANNVESAYRTALACYAKYTIKPELYDKIFTSPNKKYALKMVVLTFVQYTPFDGNVAYNYELIDCETNKIILTSDDPYSNVSLEWSSNNRYVSISYQDRYFKLADVIDVKEQKHIYLPSQKELKLIIEEKSPNTYNVDGFQFINIEKWIDENKVKVKFGLGSDNVTPECEGWYIYDLIIKEIVEIDFQKAG